MDHREVSQVRSLIEGIDSSSGGLDILVNDIGGEAYVEFDIPLWKYDWDKGRQLFDSGFTTHLLTSHCALSLLVRRRGGLVIEVTDGTREYNAGHFRSTVFLDLTKTAVDRLAYAEGHELAPYGGTAVSVTPGWLRSEMMLGAFGVTEDNWRQAAEANRGVQDAMPPYEFVISESPALLARGITALAADSQRERWNTRSVSSYDLGQYYGHTDIDGSCPDTWRFMEALESTSAEELDVHEFR